MACPSVAEVSPASSSPWSWRWSPASSASTSSPATAVARRRRATTRRCPQKCSQTDAIKQLDCRNVLYVNSIQDYWVDALPASFGDPYKPAKTDFFSGNVRTGCGAADSGVGPFYCPADDKVYIDLTFYKLLADQLGAPGEFAQPYVLAHEYGHHVQDLVGTEAEMRKRAGARPRRRQRAVGEAGAAGRLLRRRLGEERDRHRRRLGPEDLQEHHRPRTSRRASTPPARSATTPCSSAAAARSTRPSSPTARRPAPEVVQHRLQTRRPQDLRHLRGRGGHD